MESLIASAVNWSRILDALQAFDRAAAPVGLYAANEFRRPATPEAPLLVEWELALKPAFGAVGCNSPRVSQPQLKQGCFKFQKGGPLEMLQIVRLSKIKVRRYGNTFRVDPHFDFALRWQAAAVRTKVKHLLRYSRGAVLLIAFAAEERPFHEEMQELEAGLPATAQRAWPDPHGRGFNTFTALWTNV